MRINGIIAGYNALQPTLKDCVSFACESAAFPRDPSEIIGEDYFLRGKSTMSSLEKKKKEEEGIPRKVGGCASFE